MTGRQRERNETTALRKSRRTVSNVNKFQICHAKRRKTKPRASQKKPSRLVKYQNLGCLRSNQCDLNEEESIEEEIPGHENEIYFDEPFRVKMRSLIANISSYIATMEINIFHNWSCIAPEPQDIFCMLEGAEKLSCFLEEKFHAIEDNKIMLLEAENIKYAYCRSKIIVYIIKNILGRLGDINNDLTYEKIVIGEVNKHLHLIKKFGLKLPVDCSILKSFKRKLSFSDFAVMIESDLGTFSLKQTDQVKGILKSPAGEICKSNFPISFLEGRLQSYETQFSRETNNFEVKGSASSSETLNIRNNPDTLSLGSEITDFQNTSLPKSLTADSHKERKKRKYIKKQKVKESVSSSETLNIRNNPDTLSLGSEITDFQDTSLPKSLTADSHKERKKRKYIKKQKATASISSFKMNLRNNSDKSSLDCEINHLPEASLPNLITVEKKKKKYNKKKKATNSTGKVLEDNSKRTNIGNSPEEPSLGNELASFPGMPLLIHENTDKNSETKKKHKDKPKKRLYIAKNKPEGLADQRPLNLGDNGTKDTKYESNISEVSENYETEECKDFKKDTSDYPENNLLEDCKKDTSDYDENNLLEDCKKDVPEYSKNNVTEGTKDEETEVPYRNIVETPDAVLKETVEYEEVEVPYRNVVETPDSVLNVAVEYEVTEAPYRNVVEIPIPVLKEAFEYKEETNSVNANEPDKVMIPPDVEIKETNKEKSEPTPINIFSQVSAPFNNDVIKEEIVFGGEVTISSHDVFKEDTERSECIGGENGKYEDQTLLNCASSYVAQAVEGNCASSNVSQEVKGNCCLSYVSQEIKATISTSSPKTISNKKRLGKSLLRSKNNSFPGTSLLISPKHNVEKKKRPYNKKTKASVVYGTNIQQKKKIRKINLKASSSEGTFLPSLNLESEQEAKGKTVINFTQVPVVDNNGDPDTRIDSNLSDKLDDKKLTNFKIYKKSENMMPATNTIKNYFTMDLNTINNQEKFINITEDFLSKKDQGTIHENKMNPVVQSIACDANEFDLVKGLDPEFVKTSVSAMDCDIEVEVPNENMQEVIKTEKTSHYRSKCFTPDTLEKIVKVIDDPSYDGYNLKKTLSGIINESKESHTQHFHSREKSVITEHNYVKTHSLGVEFKSNSDYDSKPYLYNEILDKTNPEINNTASKIDSKNINDRNNNISDNKCYPSPYQVDSLDISCIKMNSNAVETTAEEMMNTEQFLQNSIDINYSQNTVHSDIPGNDLNSVSLTKITKRKNYLSNKVTNVKSLDLDFSDLYWS